MKSAVEGASEEGAAVTRVIQEWLELREDLCLELREHI